MTSRWLSESAISYSVRFGSTHFQFGSIRFDLLLQNLHPVRFDSAESNRTEPNYSTIRFGFGLCWEPLIPTTWIPCSNAQWKTIKPIRPNPLIPILMFNWTWALKHKKNALPLLREREKHRSRYEKGYNQGNMCADRSGKTILSISIETREQEKCWQRLC